MHPIKLEIFGRLVIASRTGDRWEVFYSGADGKRRLAKDIVVPSDVREPDLEQYLADLCHEWATERFPTVRRIK